MGVAYFVDDGIDTQIEIDRKTVDACEDVEALKDWLGGLEDLEETIQMQTRAFYLAPNNSQESMLWLARANKALAAAGIGHSRIKRRLIALGALPNTKDVQIAKLEEKLANARARIAELESAAPAKTPESV